MPLSPLDLGSAKNVIEALLQELDMEAFLFAVDHSERGWELHVECAARDGWLSEAIPLGEELPEPGEADGPLRRRLRTLLEERLRDCRKRG